MSYKLKENMDKRLQIQVDNKKVVKNSEGADVEVVFSLVLPYGVPYALASEAITELIADFNEMSAAAEKLRKEQEAQQSKPEEVKS